jgi:hypothetical protein
MGLLSQLLVVDEKDGFHPTTKVFILEEKKIKGRYLFITSCNLGLFAQIEDGEYRAYFKRSAFTFHVRSFFLYH